MTANDNGAVSKTPTLGRTRGGRLHSMQTYGTPTATMRTSPAVTMKLQAQHKALQDMQKQLESLGEERDQIIEENAQLRKNLECALAAKKKLADQVESMELEGETTYQLKERLSEMIEQETQLKKDVMKLKSDNAYLRVNNEGLLAEIERGRAQTDFLQTQVDIADQELTATKRDLNDERQMHNFAEEKLVALKREAVIAEKRLKSEIAELMSKLTSKERELQYTLIQKDDEIGELREAKNALEVLAATKSGSLHGAMNLSISQSEGKAPVQSQAMETHDEKTLATTDSGTPTPIAHSTPAASAPMAPPMRLQETAGKGRPMDLAEKKEQGEVKDLNTFMETIARQMNTGLQDQCADPELLKKYEEADAMEHKQKLKRAKSFWDLHGLKKGLRNIF